jgi:hypothetical protein
MRFSRCAFAMAEAVLCGSALLMQHAAAHEPNSHSLVAGEPAADPERSAELDPAPDLQLRYAEARLKLAELNLARAREATRKIETSIGPREIGRLESQVRLARRQVEIARERPRTTVNQTNLAAAEIAVADARADLAAAGRAIERNPGAISAINLERLRTKLELAELHLQLLEQPAYVPSLIDEMQWHIDQLTNQLIDLRHQVAAGGTADFGAPD